MSPPKAKKARTAARVPEDMPYTPEPMASSYSCSSKPQPTYAPPLPSEPPLKKSRKKAVPNAPQAEKRGAIFKKKCPQNILERVGRVMSQRQVNVITSWRFWITADKLYRFFMIDRNRTSGELREEFSVLGSTGNVGDLRV